MSDGLKILMIILVCSPKQQLLKHMQYSVIFIICIRYFNDRHSKVICLKNIQWGNILKFRNGNFIGYLRLLDTSLLHFCIFLQFMERCWFFFKMCHFLMINNGQKDNHIIKWPTCYKLWIWYQLSWLMKHTNVHQVPQCHVSILQMLLLLGDV